MIYRSAYIEKILPFVDAPFIKILTGVRRSGKSTILLMMQEELKRRGVAKEQMLSYRFDSLQYEDMKTAARLYQEVKGRLFQGGKTYLFLDEVQEVTDWEKAVNSFMADFDVDIYVTGSNSRMMSSEISTYLTGRYIAFRIYPLSFSEYLTFRKEYGEMTDVKAEFVRYLRQGGFPAVHLKEYTAEEADTIVRDIYHSTIFTDIVKRNQIRKVDRLERIVKYTFSNVGQTFSALTLSKYLKNEQRSMDVETVYSYLNKLESAYILHRCPRYDIRGKEILKTQEKFYLADIAFRHSVLGYDANSISNMIENVIYLELRTRGYDVYVGKLDGKEIDFVGVRKDEKLYIQATKEVSGVNTAKREYENLLMIGDNYPKYVLRLDDFAEGNYEGIKTMHVADFLLRKEW